MKTASARITLCVAFAALLLMLAGTALADRSLGQPAQAAALQPWRQEATPTPAPVCEPVTAVEHYFPDGTWDTYRNPDDDHFDASAITYSGAPTNTFTFYTHNLVEYGTTPMVVDRAFTATAGLTYHLELDLGWPQPITSYGADPSTFFTELLELDRAETDAAWIDNATYAMAVLYVYGDGTLSSEYGVHPTTATTVTVGGANHIAMDVYEAEDGWVKVYLNNVLVQETHRDTRPYSYTDANPVMLVLDFEPSYFPGPWEYSITMGDPKFDIYDCSGVLPTPTPAVWITEAYRDPVATPCVNYNGRSGCAANDAFWEVLAAPGASLAGYHACIYAADTSLQCQYTYPADNLTSPLKVTWEDLTLNDDGTLPCGTTGWDTTGTVALFNSAGELVDSLAVPAQGAGKAYAACAWTNPWGAWCAAATPSPGD